jgi:hypothetical protein
MTGQAVLSATVRSYEQHPDVKYVVGKKEFDAGTATGPYELKLDTTQFPNGPLAIEIRAFDSRERLAGSQKLTVNVQN